MEHLREMWRKTSAKSLDDALAELADVILSAPSKAPVNLWGDLPERKPVDWAKKLRGVEYVYRGLGIRHLSPSDLARAFDETIPVRERADHVLGMVKRNVGMHWSTHRGEAAGFAGMAADRGDLRVILTARPPALADIITDADELHRNQVFDPDREGEIPVRSGARMTIVSVEWAPGGPRPMLKSDDGGGWTLADLSRTVTATRCTNVAFEALTGLCPTEEIVDGGQFLEMITKAGYGYVAMYDLSGLTLRQLVERPEVQQGSFYLFTSGHALALVDGVLTDAERRGPDGRKVKGVYRITRRG